MANWKGKIILNKFKFVKNGYVGHMIWRIRDIRGMSSKELGIKAGFSRFTAERKIALCEGNRKILNDKDMKKVAKALNVHPFVLRNELPSHDELSAIYMLFYLHENSFITFRTFKDNIYIKFYSTFISEFLKEWDVKFTQLNKKEISYEEYVKWIIGLPDRMTEYELNAQSGHPLYKFKFVKNGYVGHMIWRIRDIHGMSRKELGIKAGFNRFTAERKVSLFENDKKILKDKDMKKIAKALNVHPFVLRNELPSHDELSAIYMLFYLHENSFITFRTFKDNIYIKFYSTFISDFLKQWDIQYKRYFKHEITYKEYIQWLISLPDRMPIKELDLQK